MKNIQNKFTLFYNTNDTTQSTNFSLATNKATKIWVNLFAITRAQDPGLCHDPEIKQIDQNRQKLIVTCDKFVFHFVHQNYHPFRNQFTRIA